MNKTQEGKKMRAGGFIPSDNLAGGMVPPRFLATRIRIA
jgi:hypothetical protein